MARFTRGFAVPFLLLAVPLGILTWLGFISAHRQLDRTREAAIARSVGAVTALVADYQDALRRVVAACRAHGKAAGILLYDHATFRPHLDLGYTFVGIGADVSYVNEGSKAALAAARAS